MASRIKRSCRRALVTRPKKDAEKTRVKLRELGFEVMMEPLLNISPCMGSKPKIAAAISRKPQAILITSANGIRKLAELNDNRELIVFCVGDTSSDAAKSFGYKKIFSASGDVNELAGMVRKKLKPEKGFLLHVSGMTVAGDLAGELSKDGFEVQKIAVYDAKPVENLSPGVKVALVNCDIDFVVFYSARTAKIFEELLAKDRLEYITANLEAYCLSPKTEMNLKWKKIHFSKKPNEDMLLELIDKQTMDQS